MLLSIDGRNYQSDVYHCDMLVAAHGHVPLIMTIRSRNGRPRRVSLKSVAREIVETVRADHPELVLVSRGRTDKGRIARPFTKLNNTAWKRARQEVDLEHCRGEGMHLRPHDLRHTSAMRLREAGCSARIARTCWDMPIMTSPRTTQRRRR